MSSKAPRSVRLRVLDMLGAIENIRDYTAGLDIATFGARGMVIDAVLRNFTILGEAAKYVPPYLRHHYTAAPWRLIIDIRNRAIHDYSGVDAGIVWRTIGRDLPDLESALRRMLAELDAADPPTP